MSMPFITASIFYVWRRAELLHRIHSHQLPHNRTPAKQIRRCRDSWEELLLKAENWGCLKGPK